MATTDRNFPAVDIMTEKLKRKEKSKKMPLSAKQYLVYTYLIIHSNWNNRTQDDHYYVRVRELPDITTICKRLSISRPTWYNAIKALKNNHLVEICNDKETDIITYYKIYWTSSYVPINIDTLKLLLQMSLAINNSHSGVIVNVLSGLYYYKKYKRDAEITITTLCKIYCGGKTETKYCYLMNLFLSIFVYLGLLEMHTEPRSYRGIMYSAICIDEVYLVSNLIIPEKDVYNERYYKDMVAAIEEGTSLFSYDDLFKIKKDKDNDILHKDKKEDNGHSEEEYSKKLMSVLDFSCGDEGKKEKAEYQYLHIHKNKTIDILSPQDIHYDDFKKDILNTTRSIIIDDPYSGYAVIETLEELQEDKIKGKDILGYYDVIQPFIEKSNYKFVCDLNKEEK